MPTKADNPIGFFGEEVEGITAVVLQLFQLKQTYRTGWIAEEKGRTVPRDKCESVGDHTFGVITWSYLIAKTQRPDLDILKVLEYALVHDMGEVYNGDIPTYAGVPKEVKLKGEEDSLEKTIERAQYPQAAFLTDILKRYNSDADPEARFVKQVDKLETAFQAAIYEAEGYKGLDAFFPYVEKRIKDPELKEIFYEVIGMRNSKDNSERGS